VDASATRVAWLALGAAVGLPILHAVRFLAHGEPGVSPGAEAVTRLVLLGTVLCALALFALRRYRVVQPSTVLLAGLVFEGLVAFALALEETAGPFGASAPAGVSAVGAWIVLAGVAVPARATWTLRAGLAAAAAWPLGYAANAIRGVAPAFGAQFVLWACLNVALAVATYVAVRNRAALNPNAAASADDVGGYHLVSRIAEGGMGEVWKATHKLLAREAAVKLIRPEVLAREGREADLAAARFRREARSIAGLQSPHTVYLYDFGVSPDGRFYYVMELLNGMALQTMVREFGPVPAGRAVSILAQMCRSLDEAHARGLVHRDLKPSNVMLCEVALIHDFVKVLDFGLAKNTTDPSATQLTLDGAATGTPGYMAPETVLGDGGVDHRADIYGLGCIAYFLLTGTPVFDEPDPVRAALMHLKQAPEPPSSRLGAPIPAALELLVLDCLAKSPVDRPPTMAAVAERLRLCPVEPWTTADARAWWEARRASGRIDEPGAIPSSSGARAQSARPRPATPA
jgi:serine/threonine-protein kinase